ncbi:MAG TPA: DUF3857 domain-containing protein, partial [Chitinophagaceae bacterium]
MKALLTLLAAFAVSQSFSQNYNVAAIPDSLKEKANAVKRYEELKVIIKSPSKAVIRHKWAITILNEEGAGHSWYYNFYDKLQSLDDINGELYDAEGKHLKSIKKKEISDVSHDDNMSLVTDARVKRFNFYYKQYPYTVEFEDEQTLDGVFHLPVWDPVTSFNLSIQQSQLVVEAPADYEIRYKQEAFDQQPVTVSDKGDRILTWKLTNYRAIEREPFLPRNSDFTPVVKLAPSDFEIEGYKGNMSTWQNLGKFVLQLNQGRDQLSPQLVKEVEQLTAGISSVEEKVKVLYKYLQGNTR